MKDLLCRLDCTPWALPTGLGLSYLFLPAISEGLRYGMFGYCALVCFGPHLLYHFSNRKGALEGGLVFLFGQLFHFIALFAVALFLLLYDASKQTPQIEPGLILFLLFVGSFLCFQLASASGVGFCGWQVLESRRSNDASDEDPQTGSHG